MLVNIPVVHRRYTSLKERTFCMIILIPETKTCMSHLLAHETFDHFSFIEGEIITFGKFTMSGFLQKSFFDEPPKEEYALCKLFRDYC